MRSLTYRQRLFVECYLGESAECAVGAARRAGYSSPHPEGARLLKKAPNRAAIAVNAIQIPSTESPHSHEEKSAFGLADRTWLEGGKKGHHRYRSFEWRRSLGDMHVNA